MSEVILELRDIGKMFRRFDHPPFLLRNLLTGGWLRRDKPPDFWPLRGVNATVSRGETVAIVGRNGSGKSTLLRLIAGAAYPSCGTIAVRGRIAPLLQLGAGFQPDMTGRECARVNGAALGLRPHEVDERLPTIESFAELSGFMDTPVRYYSSGMLARLGFAVAVHTEPDLLLVDEVLAVGDHAFQTKCLNKIDELRSLGTTILFVSHDEALVRRLCERALLIDGGALAADGPVSEIFARYTQLLGEAETAAVTPTRAPD